MIMNVPSAPEMQGTPMAPDLSMEMQPDMADVSQAEMQEAQGALMQILQVINMLIEQGLNEEQIRAFLEQYGISEDELDQAAQALGVDIDMVLSGQQRMPMAQGGPSEAALIPRQAIDAANNAIGFKLFQNDDGSLETYNPEQLENIIKVFMSEYERQLGKGNQTAANVLSNQINKLDALKIQMQAPQEPMMMANGGPGDKRKFELQTQIMQQPRPQQMMGMSDNEPMMQERLLKNQMFSTDAAIENLLKQYDISVNTGNIQDAMAISEQITNLINQKIAISERLDPVMMAEGGPGLGQKKN